MEAEQRPSAGVVRQTERHQRQRQLVLKRLKKAFHY
jgi:hypothetical protein